MKRKWVFKLVTKTEFLCLGMLGNHQESSMKKSLGNQDKYTEPSYLIRKSRHIYWTVISDTSIKTYYTEPSYLIRQSRHIYWTVISDTSIKTYYTEPSYLIRQLSGVERRSNLRIQGRESFMLGLSGLFSSL